MICEDAVLMTPAPPHPDSLPAGWHAAFAEEWNCYYYYNKDLGVVDWELPVRPLITSSIPDFPSASHEEVTSSQCHAVPSGRKKSANKIPHELKCKFQASCNFANKIPHELKCTFQDSASETCPTDCRALAWPKIHVLCNSRDSRPRLHSGTVLVMGMHCSGTKVLRKYIGTYFDVDVQPAEKISKKSDDGNARIGSTALWKHTPPVGEWPLPSCDTSGRPLTVLLTIREPCAWLLSLANHPYEVARADSGRRRKGDVNWMFNWVRMESTCAGLFHDPFAGREYESALHLWAAYAKGYLNGAMAPSMGARPTFVLVKYEDILQRPTLVMQELADLGLPRNSVSLTPIEHGVGTYSTRSQLLAKQHQDPVEALEQAGYKMSFQLFQQQCLPELHHLGYD